MRCCVLNGATQTRVPARCHQPRCRFTKCQAQSAFRLSRKEQQRRIEEPFTFQRWVSHRSTSRYTRHVLGLLSSSTLLGLTKPIVLLTLQAVIISILATLNDIHHFMPDINFHIGESPFELTSFALSLLLVFRTDSSYARYDEALKTWNSVRTGCKSFILYGMSWVDDATHRSLIVKWATAYSRSLKALVTDGSDLENELKAILGPHELAHVVADVSPPHFILQVLADLLHEAHLPRNKDAMLVEALNKLARAVDICERVLKHPIPLPYTRHTSRFMIIWLGALPFALWKECGWAVVPITTVISFLLLGIDEIAVQIEEPFGLLQLEEFCTSIEMEAAAAVERRENISSMLDLPGPSSAEQLVLVNNALPAGDLKFKFRSQAKVANASYSQ